MTSKISDLLPKIQRNIKQAQQVQPQLDQAGGNISAETRKIDNSNSNKKYTYNIQNENIIGNGTFGVVYKATINETGETVAVKKVFQDKRYKNRELQIMKDLGSHPNVINLRHYFFTHGEEEEIFLNLIMDYIPETLYRVVKYYSRRQKQPLPNILLKLYSYQLLRGLAYIHENGICHRDIKPTNVLIDPRNHVLKLCDFGSAKKLTKNEANISYICSRYYRAPELMFGAVNYNNNIDIWSVGCVIAEMIIGEPIFAGESSVDQLVEIIRVLGTPSAAQVIDMNPNQSLIKLPQIKGLSWRKVFKGFEADPLCVDLISKILIYSPQKRLKPFEALMHPYFNELRLVNCKINGNDLPELFNFNELEIGNQKEAIKNLQPSWYLKKYEALKQPHQ